MKILNNFKQLVESIKTDKTFKKSIELSKNSNSLTLNNIKGSLKSILVSEIFNQNTKKVFLLTPNIETSISYLNDLELLINPDLISRLFELPKHTRNKLTIEDENKAWLINSLQKTQNLEKYIGIINIDSFHLNLPDSLNFDLGLETIEKGKKYNFIEFSKELIKNGFTRTDYVSKEGEIAIRGGIIDFYPISMPNPVRLEFWGDELESIREFELNTQRSIKEHNSLKYFKKFFQNKDFTNSKTIKDIIPSDAILIIDSPDLCFIEENPIENLPNDKIFLNSIKKADLKFNSDEQMKFDSSIVKLNEFLINDIQNNQKIFFCAESKSHIERLNNIIHSNLENNFDFSDDKAEEFLNKFYWFPSTFSTGFSFNNVIHLFTEHQIFERNRIPEKTLAKNKNALSMKELNSLKLGDYIVHEDKGIGKFEGFRSVKIGSNIQDCIQIAFDGGDVVYVNMQYVYKIQRYSAQEGIVPKLSKLGSPEWNRKKSKTKNKIKEVARELIKLYAKRKMQAGFAFQPDTNWQKEFEASFIYDDTIDQAKATQEIKEDMESVTPMDRLLCGDVGFGKTEVAIRAAFKAVQSNKQVAVLVPTTVLSQQHYMTFKDRLSKYPVSISSLSRFRSKKEQNESVAKLKEGKVDILIGTHRILSKDVEFKDLGLLIIDEEQRFGVKAKEKLREMRVSVDTLTLTATPIPRTLNFSLMGARDLSVIETPPRNRLPVYTEILEFDLDFIKEAIDKEMKREGQVFFVSDRIQDLEKILIDLKMSMPLYQFAIAHGQMPPNILEKIMQDFISRKIDVLITTKIVESGLDIPNANTMIINRANNFGLAELYQLRGRVGRTNTQAYCYLLLDKGIKINPTAIKRLEAIEEFTDLGSGFQLALRDMEIRGAGNLLGSEQSGMIYEIGFELYQKILDEAVNELKKEEFSDIFKDTDSEDFNPFENKELQIEINQDAYIPDYFIQNDTERFNYYKQFYALKKQKELLELTKEIKDKYGKFPVEFENLIFVIKLRINSIPSGFSKLIIKNDKLILEFPPSDNTLFYNLAFPHIIDFINTYENSKLIQGRNKLTWEKIIHSRDECAEIMWKLSKIVSEIDE